MEDKTANNFYEGSQAHSEHDKTQDSSPLIHENSFSENRKDRDNEILKNLVHTLNEKLKSKIKDYTDPGVYFSPGSGGAVGGPMAPQNPKWGGGTFQKSPKVGRHFF